MSDLGFDIVDLLVWLLIVGSYSLGFWSLYVGFCNSDLGCQMLDHCLVMCFWVHKSGRRTGQAARASRRVGRTGSEYFLGKSDPVCALNLSNVK